jgi:thioredoxin reductase
MRPHVLVIGAGPYGLSLAAHLMSRDVRFRIVGEPMSGWKNHMPERMFLKSQPWASSLASPDSAFSIDRFYAEEQIDYDPVFHYVPLETFISYGEAFQRRYVPHVERKTLVALTAIAGGFRAQFDDGEVVEAARVVLAVGLAAFRYLPRMVDQLPSELVSHSSEYGSFVKLHGKRVIIVGSGSSAIDLAVFLHEAGIEASIVARAPKMSWGEAPTLRLLRDRVRYPDSGIGTSWPFMVAVYAPWAVHYLPDHLRLRFAYTGGLGPLGGFPMRHRFEDKVPAFFGRNITRTRIHRGMVELDVTTADSKREVLSADHVIFATGYQIDVNQLGFLDPVLVSKMNLIGTAPRLSQHYESSIPGLHFIGPATAPSFGPVFRFVYGTMHPARHLSRYFSLGQILRENVRESELSSVA